jgi:hypothetical protein
MKKVVVAVGCLLLCLVALDIALFLKWQPLLLERRADLYISFYASLAEDTVFFLLIGLGTLLITLRNPTRDTLETKLRYFFPDKRPSLAFLDFARTEIQRIAGFCMEADQQIKVMEYSAAFNAYRVSFSYQYRICNMFSTHRYEDHFQAFISPDSFADSPDRPSVLGQVTELEFTARGTHPRRLLLHPVDLNAGDYDRDIPLELEPMAEGEVFMRYWLWVKIGEEHYLRVKRFVGHLTSTIDNASDDVIRISLNKDGQNTISIRSGEKQVLGDFRNLRPRYIHTFWWVAPPKKR